MNKYIIFGFFFTKLLISGLFSSEYLDQLFIPFLNKFLEFDSNPWDYFLANGKGDEFPYHPLLLYILSASYAPVYYAGIKSPFLISLAFKIPTMIADMGIYLIFRRLFPDHKLHLVLFYIFSPIVFYGAYMHSQVDLIPTAVLFASTYLAIKSRFNASALFMGLALCMKLHVLAALPLLLWYVWKSSSLKQIVRFGAIIALVYIFFTLPWFFSPGFQAIVLQNPKQSLLFETIYKVGGQEIYIPLLAMLVICFRFFAYHKINADLFFTYLAILFALFILLIPPGPAWYIWMLPFLTIFFIKNLKSQKYLAYLYGLLNITYLVYFLFFHSGDYKDLLFLGENVLGKIESQKLSNIAYTILATLLLAGLYGFYRFGVKSNSVYSKDKSIIIGIGGDSGAGKTTLLDSFKSLLGNNALHLEGDADHRWERNNPNWNEYTHLDPKANYLARQAEQLIGLKFGQEIQRGEYDHATGKFTKPQKLESHDFVLLSGLHPFYLPKLRQVIDIKIFLKTEERLRLHWKIIRDTAKRGYSPEKIREQISKREGDSKKYIQPQEKYADIVVRYFSPTEFEAGDAGIDPEISLKLVVNSEYHLEEMIAGLELEGIEFEWDYLEDLSNQKFVFNKVIDGQKLQALTRRLLPNYEELVVSDKTWKNEYNSITRMFFLLILSQVIKKQNDN